MITIQRVLFPTDFSDLSLHVLAYARSFVESYGAELHLIHVVDEASMYWLAMGPSSLPVGPSSDELVDASTAAMTKFIDDHLSDIKDAVHSEVVLGRPFMRIIEYARAQQIDMIVLGTHGRSGLQHALLGSVTEKVVRKAPCPVLTIRDPGHEFVMP